MTKKNDSAFYTDSPGTQVVWEQEGCDFYVVRAGEMRIHAIDEKGTAWIIRYTDQLEDFGVKNDEQLAEWSEKGNKYDGIFEWINNSWFEVYTDKDPDYFTEPLHDLEEAIEVAKTLKFDGEEVTNA